MYGFGEVYWGILLVAYPYITGLVAGSFIVSTLSHVFGKEQYRPVAKLALIVSVVFLLIATLPLLIDLGQPSRAFLIFTRTHVASPMAVFGWILISYIILAFIEGWFLFREGLIRNVEKHFGIKKTFYKILSLGSFNLSNNALRRDFSIVRILGAIGIPLACLFHAYVGFIFGALEARALWVTPLMPVIFLLSAIVSGIALLILVDIGMRKFFSSTKKVNSALNYHMGGLLAWFILLDLGFNTLEMVTRGYSGEEEWFAASLLLTGQLSWSYLGVEIILGLLVPFVILSIPSIRRHLASTVAASILVLIGVFAMRYNIVIGGQLIPRTGQAFLTYSASIHEIASLIGIFAVAFFIFTIGVWILPWEHESLKLHHQKEALPEDKLVNLRAFTQRDFLKFLGLFASLALFVGSNLSVLPRLLGTKGSVVPPVRLAQHQNVKIKYSICLQCNSYCGIRCKIIDGKLAKIDGNPYHPCTLEPHLDYSTSPETALAYIGSACAKAQAGIETLYNPYRVKQPLKRVGPRGSDEWIRISWDQAFEEIANGGYLFADVPGEETRYIEGLKDLHKFIDKETVQATIAKVQEGRSSIDVFRESYRDKLIDPDAWELGPKTNQVLMITGRAAQGRMSFIKRFFNNSFGTVNVEIDTSTNESRNVATKLVTGGKQDYKPDILNCEFMMLFGSSYLESGLPFIATSRKTVTAVNDRFQKYMVIDPRYSHTAAHAWKWIPIIPGTDGALVMGMIRWIIENNKHNIRYLENTTKNSAASDNEPTYTNATSLINLEDRKIMRKNGKSLVWTKGSWRVFDEVEHGDLDPGQVTVDGKPCKTAFTLLRENAFEYELADYAKICGIKPETIIEMAEEFTNHGERASAEAYGGATQHTNGIYNQLAILTLNLLIGNACWKGGLSFTENQWNEMGGGEFAPYDLKLMHLGKVEAWGVPLSRSGYQYEGSLEFKRKGYPSRRPWFPLASNVLQETLAGIAEAYPYPAKALFILDANPVYSMPGMKEVIEHTFKDLNKLPLIVSIDTVISETSVYADYILPDLSSYEQYGTAHVSSAILTKTNGIIQPVVDKLHPETMPTEDALINIALMLKLPGYGDNGFGTGMPLNNAKDWYWKMFVNIASEGGGVTNGSEEDKANYVLDRGGRFEIYDKMYDGEYLQNQYMANGGRLDMYIEDLALTKDSVTGKYFFGLAKYIPIMDVKGNPVEDKGYPFHLITYTLAERAKSKTIVDTLLLEIWPENLIMINPSDARMLTIKDGDIVKILSATNKEGVTGKVKLIEGIKKGVVAISESYGHWLYGASQNITNGVITQSIESRQTGTTPNPVMRLDTSIGSVCLQDKVGGSASFLDTKIKIEKV